MKNLKCRKHIVALTLCLTLVMPAPIVSAMEEKSGEQQKVQKEAASESDFIIENGVLTGYTGTDSVVVIPEGVTTIGDYVFECY